MSDRQLKHADAVVKTVPSDGSGRFTALVSTFSDVPDADGDLISPTAYDAWLVAAKAGAAEFGTPLLPLFWQHDYVPESAIGVIDDARVTPDGLVVSGRLSLDNPRALATYEGMLAGSIRAFSIGFKVRKATRLPSGAQLLLDIDLLEVSAVANGADRDRVERTRLLSIKTRTTNTSNSGGTYTIDAAKDSGRMPTSSELPRLSRVAEHLNAIHGYPRSGLVSRSTSELTRIHRDLHDIAQAGRGESHPVSDLGPVLPDELRQSMQNARKAATRPVELSRDAQAFVDRVRAERRAKIEAEQMRADLWIENSKRANAMRDVTLADEQRQEERERAAWIADSNIVEGETHRIPIDGDSAGASIRVAEDDLHNGNTAAGEVR